MSVPSPSCLSDVQSIYLRNPFLKSALFYLFPGQIAMYAGTKVINMLRRALAAAFSALNAAANALLNILNVCQYGSRVGGGDKGGIAAQPAALDGSMWRLDRVGRAGFVQTLLHLFGGQVDIEAMFDQVDGDQVAIDEGGDGATCRRFGRDMADAGPARAARETAIGDERDLLAEAHAHDVGGGRKHLLHAGTAARPLVANDHHVSLSDMPVEDARARLFLRIINARRANVAHHRGCDGADLDDGPVGREIAGQDGKAAALAMGRVDGTNNFRVLDIRFGDILAQRSERDGRAVEVEDAGLFREFLQDGADAARAVNIFHMPFVGRADLAQVRRALGDGVDALKRIFDARLLSNRQGMQNSVGRAAHRHVQREGVVNRFGVDNLARREIGFDKLQDHAPGLARQFAPRFAGGEPRAIAGQGDAQRLHQAIHRVGGEHAGAGAAGRAGILFKGKQFLVIDLARLVRAHTLEDADEVDGTAIGQLASRHRAAADEDSGDIEAHRCHQHARHNLVAIGDADHAVEAVRLDHRLHTIGNQFAAGQRVFHADMAHGNAVINADGVELKGNAARRTNGLFDQLAKRLQMDMSRHHVHIGIADGDERLVEIVFAYDPGRAQQPPVRRSLKTEFDLI